MTDTQRELFSKVVDLNWDFTNETKSVRKFELFTQLNAAKTALKEAMGENEYNVFMDRGKKMFAPKNEETPVIGEFDEDGDLI